jgi:hypothetical protein
MSGSGFKERCGMTPPRYVASVAILAFVAAVLVGLVAWLDDWRPEIAAPGSPKPHSGFGPTSAVPNPSATLPLAAAGPRPAANVPSEPTGESPDAAQRQHPWRGGSETAPVRHEGESRGSGSDRGHLVLVFAQADKEVYELGEPVRIRRILENPGKFAVPLARAEGMEPPFGTVEISSRRGSRSYTPSGSPDPKTRVEPGGRLESEIVVELHEAGEYTIGLHSGRHVRIAEGVPSVFRVSVADRGNPLPLDAMAARLGAKIAAEEPGHPDCGSQAQQDLEAMGLRAVPHLRRWLRESESAHLRAVSAKLLWFVKGKEGIEELVGGLKDPDAKVRETCLESLRDFREPWTLTAVLPLVGDPDEHVRAEAVWTASAFEDSRVIPALRSALADRDGWVRSQAARHLAEKGDPSGAGILIEVLRKDPEDGPGGVVPALERIAGVSFGKAEHPFIHSSMDRIERATRTNKELAARWLEWWEKEGKARFERK